MAEKNFRTDNKSFMIYKDWEELVLMLDDAQAGKLFKALFVYAKTGDETALDGMTTMAFTVMRNAIDRDGQKWVETCQKRKESIQKRWAKRNNDNTNNTNEYNCISEYTNHTDIDKDIDKETDIVIDKDTDIDTEKEIEKEIDTVIVEEKEEDTVNEMSSSMSSSSSLSSYREDFSRVIFSDEDKEELFNMSDRQQIERYIDRISAWQQANRRYMKDPCRTIKKWLREDGRKPSYYDRGYQGYSGGSYGYRNHSESERERIDREAKELARRVAEFEATLDFDTLST